MHAEEAVFGGLVFGFNGREKLEEAKVFKESAESWSIGRRDMDVQMPGRQQNSLHKCKIIAIEQLLRIEVIEL